MTTPVLRIEALPESPCSAAHRLVLRCPDRPDLTADFTVNLSVSGQQHEDLRWYLEEYAQYPEDPAPRTARRVETWMSEAGASLFQQTFGAEEGQAIWRAMTPRLAETRVELASSLHHVVWLQMRHPQSDKPLALQVRSFVQTSGNAEAESMDTSLGGDQPIRVLIVICRPRLSGDVPFRSIAAHLLMSPEPHAPSRLHMDVLRPPTVERLQRALTGAAERGQPYHVVHFDGHGVFEDPFGTGRPRGYVVFENPAVPDNRQYVHGALLGRLLKEGRAPILMLNACRSARSESQARPGVSGGDSSPDRAKAYGSLAEEVVRGGVPGVVAMSFNVYVVTAAHFTANLYQALTDGYSLGEAVTIGRRKLFEDPRRAILQSPVELQDWVTPLVYETSPISVGRSSGGDVSSRARLKAAASASFSSVLAPRPEAGVIGMDDALLSIDRGFDRASIVLLHGYAGSGKTSTAVEFADWYRTTGGLQGPVLLNTFDRHLDLEGILDQAIEPVFADKLGQKGRNWLALTPAERRQTTLELFEETPVLWIWDNVEPVAGFPAPSDSAWSEGERRELLDFLKEAVRTKAKFLLTSRREENDWLGELPIRVMIPPLPVLERFQMAVALARRYGSPNLDMAAWRPLMNFTAGNPLTLLVLVKQALQEKLTTLASVNEFLERVKTGATPLEDDERQGRSSSLGASLRYGFEKAFTEEERAYLSLLYLFRGAVDPGMLRAMCETHFPWHLSRFKQPSMEVAQELLNRAAAIGLLSPAGRYWYTIHPALPWFFHQLFQKHHGAGSSLGSEGHERDCRLAYACAGRVLRPRSAFPVQQGVPRPDRDDSSARAESAGGAPIVPR